MKKAINGNRRVENGRLAYYQDASTPQLWESSGTFFRKVIQKMSDYLPYARKNLGHMLLVVAEKS